MDLLFQETRVSLISDGECDEKNILADNFSPAAYLDLFHLESSGQVFFRASS